MQCGPDPTCEYSISLSTMHGMQLLALRSALNEKDLDLIELREQHVTLVVSHAWVSWIAGYG